MSSQLGFSITHKVRNHIHGKVITYKNQMGLVADIPYTEPFFKEDNNTCFIDVELKLFDLKAVKFNLDRITNKLDRVIVERLVSSIEEVKKRNSYIDMFPTNLGETITVNVCIGVVETNYRANGYQCDMFGFTVEFKEDTFPGGYKDEEYHEVCLDILEENDIVEEGSFVRDFIWRLYRIVDNHHQIGSLWVTLGGEPVKIDPVRDLTKQSGIYIYSGTGGHPLKVINPNDITKELLTSYGLSKTKLDMEQNPHSKVYTELNRTIDSLKKKVKDVELALEKSEKQHKVVSEEFALHCFRSEEKDRVINKLKEELKGNKELESRQKTDLKEQHKQELERIKFNSENSEEKLKRDASRDNIGNFVKLLKDIIPACMSVFKIFA